MISLSQTWYGSATRPAFARHGKLRRCRSYQASKARAIALEGFIATTFLPRRRRPTFVGGAGGGSRWGRWLRSSQSSPDRTTPTPTLPQLGGGRRMAGKRFGLCTNPSADHRLKTHDQKAQASRATRQAGTEAAP